MPNMKPVQMIANKQRKSENEEEVCATSRTRNTWKGEKAKDRKWIDEEIIYKIKQEKY